MTKLALLVEEIPENHKKEVDEQLREELSEFEELFEYLEKNRDEIEIDELADLSNFADLFLE